jgi:hypothetical protein
MRMIFGDKLQRSVYIYDSGIRTVLEIHTEELHKLYFSPNVVSVITAKIIKCRSTFHV